MFKKLLKFSSQTLKVVSSENELGQCYFLKNKKTDKVESFWTSILPTKNDFKTVNCVIEVPRGNLAKFQLIKEIKDHPIAQDKRTLNGQEINRFFQMGTLFNYGYIPQTWDANLSGKYHIEGLEGDKDPIDIVELSSAPILTMLPIECIVIGALGLIDQGEVDWKIIVLAQEYAKQNGIKTFEEAMSAIPERFEYVKEYYRMYKTHEGKKINRFVNNENYFDEKEAIEIVKNSHEEFKQLITDENLKNYAKLYNLI